MKKELMDFLKSSLDYGSMNEKDAYEDQDVFLLMCFSDLIGVPNPYAYYMSELLPYIARDLPSWQWRLTQDKLEFLGDAEQKYDFHTF
ncbi:MAG: hypothetical protein KGY66_06770 [Candidatus Thermoplasmatota archaeon]|nr:hypothetical protein [Candidatus Thermoplasmatota archaeon]MBS3790602.1 hypothetical protein [Candidatus Thermoplasmatota archaeon]